MAIGLITYSFALRKNREPNPCNVNLSRETERIVAKLESEGRGSVRAVLQWETAIDIKLGYDKVAHVVYEHRIPGQYLDSEEVTAQAIDFVFRPEGITDVVLVAQPFLQLTKVRQQARNAGLNVIKEKVNWIGFDKESDQPWTRGPVPLLIYAVNQMIQGKLSEKPQ